MPSHNPTAHHHTDLSGPHRLGVGQTHAFLQIHEQVAGQSAPGQSWPDAIGNVVIFGGDEHGVGDVVDHIGWTLLGGFQDDGHAAFRGELDVKADDEVLGVVQLQGHAF